MLHLPVKDSAKIRLLKGYPWVYTRDLLLKTPMDVPPGTLVYLVSQDNEPFAIGYYNPLTQLACRVLTVDPTQEITVSYFQQQLLKALAYRQQNFTRPFYRLVHAEGDQLPGLIIDRFDKTLVCQTNTAGMELLKPLWLSALESVVPATRIILRDNTPSRQKEGLALSITAHKGALEGEIPIEENEITFYADPSQGQKTGWFFDQRTNRHWIASRAVKKTVLDLYSYSGGFGILAAARGAKQVTLVDSSENALSLAKLAAQTNNILSQCDFVKSNVFDFLEQLISNNQLFEIVLADPPAFVKLQRLKGPGLKGYEKLAKQASLVVAPKGMLMIASCSHHASTNEFRQAVEAGIAKAGRMGTLMRKAGADRDHPIHRLLPENHYLKSLAYRLD